MRRIRLEDLTADTPEPDHDFNLVSRPAGPAPQMPLATAFSSLLPTHWNACHLHPTPNLTNCILPSSRPKSQGRRPSPTDLQHRQCCQFAFVFDKLTVTHQKPASWDQPLRPDDRQLSCRGKPRPFLLKKPRKNRDPHCPAKFPTKANLTPTPSRSGNRISRLIFSANSKV